MACNNNLLNITVGTDVVLNVTLYHNGSSIDASTLSDVSVNLVSTLGKVFSLSYTVVDEKLLVVVPWDDEMLAGIYSLSVTATTANNLAFASVMKAIRYTSTTESGSTTVSTDGDTYDFDMTVGFIFGESDIAQVFATIDNNTGIPAVDVTYEDKILTLNFKNLKGNGIASIVQTRTSTVSSGENIVTITRDDGSTAELSVFNGSKGETGPKGPQGDSAVFDPDTGNILATLHNTTGDDDANAMTQKAVTEALEDERFYAEHGDVVSETDILNDGDHAWYTNRYINGDTGATGRSSGWQACADIYVTEYNLIRLSAPNMSTVAGYCFYDANGNRCTNGGANGTGVGDNYIDTTLNIPEDAVRMGISVRTDYETYGTPYVYGIKTEGGIIECVQDIAEIKEGLEGDEEEIKTSGWIAGYIGSNGTGHTSSSYCLSQLINAEGLTLVRSNIDANISVNCYDASYNHLGLTNPYGKEFTTLPMECAYFRIWFPHSDLSTAAAAVTIKRKPNKVSRTARLDGKAIVTFGDSITWYDQHTYNNGKAEGDFVFGYQHYLRTAGMMVDNQGESGKTMPWVWSNKVQSYGFFDNVDYMTVFLGANDSKNGVSVGEVADVGSTFDTDTYTGALQAIVEYALSQNDELKIVLFTPIVGWVYGTTTTKTSRNYVNAVKAVGALYGLPVIDIYDTIGLNELTRNIMINDPEPPENTYYSLHPSNYGYKRMADVILPQLADA